jgi:DNA repair protein RadC
LQTLMQSSWLTITLQGNVDHPSSADKTVTDALVGAGKLLEVQILDHVIIGASGGFYSFRDSSSLIT